MRRKNSGLPGLGCLAPALAACLWLTPSRADEGRITGSDETRFSATRDGQVVDRFFETWVDLAYRKDAYLLDVGYEAHLPPAPASRDTAGQGIYNRTFGYSREGLDFKAGNYFAKLGNGLTLVAQRNRDVGFNTNLDGIYAGYAAPRLESKLMAGSPRDAAGRRYASLEAGELRVPLPHGAFTGVTYVTTNTASVKNDYWGSLYAGINGTVGSLQVEWAARSFVSGKSIGLVAEDYRSAFPEGKALYASGNLMLGDLALSAEGKHYRLFNLYEGAIYNSPPACVREHVFSLPNKRQPVQNADDEQGVHLSAEYPVIESGVLAFDYNKSLGVAKEFDLYEEYYGQFEYDAFTWCQGIAAAGTQTDLESRNLNFILQPSLPMGERYGLKAEFQHQHTTIALSRREFYSQHFALSVERSSSLALSLIAESTTDQLEKSDLSLGAAKFWSGIQANFTLAERLAVTLFAGSRRKGKVCAGGVCVQKPELKGMEAFMTSRF